MFLGNKAEDIKDLKPVCCSSLVAVLNTESASCYLSKFSCLLQNFHFPLSTTTGVVGVPLTLDH